MNGNEQELYQIEFSSKFEKTFSSLPDEIQRQARDALRKFVNGPRGSLRVHTYKNIHPPYVVIDVMPNHSYQIAFRKKGKNVYFADYIGTHKRVEAYARSILSDEVKAWLKSYLKNS